MTRTFDRVNVTIEVSTDSKGGIRAIKKVVVVKLPQKSGSDEEKLIVEPHVIHANSVDELILVQPGQNMVLPDHCIRTSQNFGELVRACGQHFGFSQRKIANFCLGSCLILNCPDSKNTKRVCYACIDEKAIIIPTLKK